MTEIIYQECNRCHERKPITEFYIKKLNKNGYEKGCKTCYGKRVKYRGDGHMEPSGKKYRHERLLEMVAGFTKTGWTTSLSTISLPVK